MFFAGLFQFNVLSSSHNKPLSLSIVNRLDHANRSFFYLQNANRWLQLRLEVLGSLILCSVALIVVWSREERDGGLTYGTGNTVKILGDAITVGVAGLVLTYTQQITGLMNVAIRQACDAESRMTCVERNGECEPGLMFSLLLRYL